METINSDDYKVWMATADAAGIPADKAKEDWKKYQESKKESSDG